MVVAATSVLINLALVGHGDLLKTLFQEVVVPPAVQSEFVRLAADAGSARLGSQADQAGNDNGWKKDAQGG